MLYAKSTGGFYDRGIHGNNIPADAVEISRETHSALLDGQAKGKLIAADDSGFPILRDTPAPTVDQLKEVAMLRIDEARDKALVAGFMFNGTKFDSDNKSIQRISSAVTLSLLDPAFTTPWITWDNDIINLDAAGLSGLGQAAAAHEGALVFRARGLKDEILAAETAAEIASIVWE